MEKYLNSLENAGKPANNVQMIVIIACVVAAIAALIIAFVFINAKLLFPKKVKKEVSDLSRKYEYLHACLINQDTMKVKRLEIISRTNLLYGQKHSEFNTRLKDLKAKTDANVNARITGLKDFLMDKDYKNAHLYADEVKRIIADFELKVNSFEEDIMVVIKPGEDAKQAIVETQEKYRKCKVLYNEFGDEVSLLRESFSKVFTMVDELFTNYDNFVDSANYEESDELFPRIVGTVNELEALLKVIPNLCAALVNIIPDKLRSLKRTYHNLSDEGYPLSHLAVINFTDATESSIKNMLNQLKGLQVSGVQENIDHILADIDTLNANFNMEVEAKKIYEEQYDGVENEVNSIKKRIIKLRNSISEVQKVFVLRQTSEQELNDLQEEVNKALTVKRTLDTYLHSYSMQPFTLIVRTMEDLKTILVEVSGKLGAFEQYLDSLKTYSQDAYASLFIFYKHTKSADEKLRAVSIDAFTKKYESKIKHIYKVIDQVYDLLKVLPIDVELVMKYKQELEAYEDEFIKKIDQEYTEYQSADATILYCNRHRGQLADVDVILNQAEELYNSGEFEQAYLKACESEKLIDGAKEADSKKK